MLMENAAVRCVTVALVFATLTTISGTAGAKEPLLALPAVIDELRNGGFVIYFRHAATEQITRPDETADIARCETQRNLSAQGRAQAVEIGKAIKALAIPVGAVQVSPFCRTKETAQLAFGHYEVNSSLFFVMSKDAAETKQLSNELRALLSTVPQKGTNTVLVSHSANLMEAAGIFAKPEGAAYVFRPLPSGGFQAVARIPPEEWARVAKLSHTRRPRTCIQESPEWLLVSK
jgi:phosphohistidine phosphatase SixA